MAVGAAVTVHFADLANTGMPATAAGMAAEMVGFQWQFQSVLGDGGTPAACNGIAMTIDNVSFVSN